ncbi:organic solute transporter Ostalpha-domain-containing protein [Suillus bovinus]|uniref:organic solute transporter Ostalpha-domain-containing protein n=1 Tax=Suillus bovinus TaxID=48563 RepID=UPI001B8724A2|nr:organic solute transporter Ostalpha-domain-containing protein [Suillus bovinus]KAG2130418.1 organic solute transporter Ostalpha-domain-containing protein [Suillus bovinus]
MVSSCPSDNTSEVDQSSFWSSGNLNWDQHRIGWAIAGGCAMLTVLISVISVSGHCRNYTKPSEQRQILRILYMPPVYAVISFFSYRYFRSYTYYSLIEAAYEAVTLSAFLLLLIEFVAATATGGDATKAIERKDKRPLPIPFCCWRYRPTKPYFMYTLKWSVLQYVIIRPAVSIAGIICQVYNVLCESGPYSIYYANVYLEAADFASISVALYGLLLFYGLTKEELVGRRPLAKFLSIKLIVMFTFYQSFVFSALEGRVIKATQYWTAANIADGLNALTICIEMVFFSVLMMWAYTVNEYKVPGNKKTSIWRPLWDSVNYWDFVTEIAGSLKFFFNHARGASSTHSSKKTDFAHAFGINGRSVADGGRSTEESIRLAPYPYSDPHNADSASPVLS